MSPTERLEAIRSAGGTYPLGPRTRLLFRGSDTKRYLNGQLSNDISKLQDNSAMEAVVLTAKGKLCGHLFVFKDGDAYLLDAPLELAEDLAARMERYIVADDVEMTVLEPAVDTWHVFGPAAAKFPEALKIQRLGIPGVDIAARPEGILETSEEEREILRIERGIPIWGRELSPDTLPHEARLESTAVDFHKGCYVGQEVVSRIESVGRTNRILTGLLGDFPPGLTATLATPDGTPAGVVTSSILHFGLAQTAALGYVNTRIPENRFHVLNAAGQKLGECQRHEFPLV